MAATNGGFLITPRSRVFWGDVNLTSYDKFGGAPIVYDVEVTLQGEAQGPTASFNWDPTGPGFAEYEAFLSNPKYLQGKISIEYFYPGGKRIAMFFRWAGQTINYGNDMTVKVKLQSELAGLVNANQRSTAQAYDDKGGKNLVGVYNRLTKQYGLEGQKKILTFNKLAKEQSKDVEISTSYGASQTYGSAIANAAKQAGHTAYANAVGFSGIIIFPPYSAKDSQSEEVMDGAARSAGSLPDPAVRYGYLLGPGIIDNVTRDYTWKPPQQSNSNVPSTQQFAALPRDEKVDGKSTDAEKDESKAAAKKTSSPLGVSGGRANPGVRFAKNPKGPARQNALNEEKTATLSFSTMMVPVLTGIKPHDIVFIPSLKGEYIEDWIVNSVSYKTSNGKVEVSVQATRIFGAQEAMNNKMAKKFLGIAKNRKLVGQGATLEAWDDYAWRI